MSALLTRASANDQRAWDAIVERYAAQVWAIARAHGLSAEDAAEVTQVTWLRLAQRLGPPRRPARLAAWLATTARQESLRLQRLRGREVPVALQTAAPDTGLLAVERDAALWQALQSLPVPCQLRLRLRIAEPPLTPAEIAAMLETPVGAVDPPQDPCLDCLRRAMTAREPPDNEQRR